MTINQVLKRMQQLNRHSPEGTIKAYLASIGRRGGKQTSPAKREAAKRNAMLPRKRVKK